ncbi:MAG: alpha-glucuronidase [Lachnospiraceae bacterium]|nr:alpha-glucuronidase [Lachnospiraceae bacterium]
MEKYAKLWLKYSPKKNNKECGLLKNIVFSGSYTGDKIIENAKKELCLGLKGMLDITPVITEKTSGTACNESAKGTLSSGKAILDNEEYTVSIKDEQLVIASGSSTGILYGVFDILRTVACEKDVAEAYSCMKKVRPSNPLRMLNHWDNMDGSIERGYSGRSFFYENNEIIINERTVDYARLIASVGINAVVINNVNVKQAASYMITDRYFEKLAELGEIFAGYGIGLYLSLNYASTIEIGGMESADPLDEDVKVWWKEKMAEVFKKIPTLKGFLVKADSEGRPGPFTYGRTQADGANMLADIAKEHGAIIIWRCFVYNCRQDWRDKKTDRARAGYDNFMPMDGDYHDNVILQIKNGPMDFQIREPISPLFGGLRKTNQMLEVQIAQEYTGQQIDLCYLIPMFKEILEFRTYCTDEKDKNWSDIEDIGNDGSYNAGNSDTVADIISGRTFGSRYSGIAAVTNTGNDFNWTGDYLAGANLFGFGRLAFDTGLSSAEIAEEFIRMTISGDDDTVDTIKRILLPSRAIYEKYTCPLGIGWMVKPNTHYGCSVDGYEYDRWGTYHRADHLGLGVDRTDKGTGYALQYNEPNASIYNSAEKCPDELVLFFHHLPYTHVLHSGKTVIQHIYDSHFEGYEEAKQLAAKWETLKDKVDPEIFNNVSERFTRQLYNAREWCDQVNTYFHRISGIEDAKGREIY